MAKNKVSEFSTIAANNTDIAGIDIAEGCAPSGINNAIRELMAQLKDQQTGVDGDNFTVGGNLNVTGTTALGTATATTVTGSDNSTNIATTAFVQGKVGTLGTMSTQNANAVAITGGAISGLSSAIPVASGGTGASSLTANNVLLGNGTSAVQSVAPSTSGNALLSNGTNWVSQALFASTLSANGYVKFPNGLAVAWGSMSTSNSGGGNNNFYTISGSATLPVTFTSTFQAIVGFGSTGVFYGAAIGVNSLTTTTLSVAGSSPYGGGNPSVNYIVIGTI